jgi:hypothetical protein
MDVRATGRVGRRPFTLLPAFLLAAAGCSSNHVRTCPDFSQRIESIRRVALLPSLVRVGDEQVTVAMHFMPDRKVVANEGADRLAALALRSAFADELEAAGRSFVAIPPSPAVDDIADLFGAVDYSILSHALDLGQGGEAFATKMRRFDYSLGDLSDLAAGDDFDAVWIVTGFNLIPTAGVHALEAVELTIAILGALGGAPAGTHELPILQIRAALVARNGDVLFYDVIDRPESGPPSTTGSKPLDESQGSTLCDFPFARRVVRRLLADCQKAAGR